MAVATLALPQWLQLDGRYVFAAMEANNNLVVWPNNANGACVSLAGASGNWTTLAASHTVTQGPEVSPASVRGSGISGSGFTQLVTVTLDNQGAGLSNVYCWFPANVAFFCPAPISQILASTAGALYTIT